MGKIREYTPQADVQGPVAAPGRRADPAGMNIGQGLEDLGKGIQTLGTGLNAADEARRKSQTKDELLALKQSTGPALEKLQQSFQKRMAEAGPNTDINSDSYKNMMSDYQTEIDNTFSELGQNIQTKEGQDYFKEVSAGYRDHLMRNAFHEKAVAVGDATGVAFNNQLKLDSAGVMNDPTSFDVRRNAQVSWIAKQIKNGSLDVGAGSKLTEKVDMELAQGAVRGMAKLNPDAAEKSLNDGHWDQFLGGDAKAGLLREINTERRAQKADVLDRERKNKEAVKAAQDATQNDLISKFVDGSLAAKDVANANIDPDKKMALINKIEAAAKNPQILNQTRHEVYNSLYDRIAVMDDSNPAKITDQAQIDAEFYAHRISGPDHQRLTAILNKSKTEEGKQENATKAAAMQSVKETIYRGAGPKDPIAPQAYYRFQSEFQKYYDGGIKAGKSPSELLDPKNIEAIARPFIPAPKQRLEAKAVQASKFKERVIKQTGGSSPADRLKAMREFLQKRRGG